MNYGHDRTTVAYEALSALRTDLARLEDLRGEGPIRRATGWGPTPEQIAQAGRRHMEERADTLHQLSKGLAPIGASPAPADLVVLDTIRDVRIDLGDLLDACIDRVAPTTNPAHTSARRIGQLVNLLTKIGAVPDLLDHLLSETQRMRARVRYALGENEEIRQLRVRCPLCGARSLRELTARGLIMCSNTMCRCADPTCPCSDPDRPRRHQWNATDFMEHAA